MTESEKLEWSALPGACLQNVAEMLVGQVGTGNKCPGIKWVASYSRLSRVCKSWRNHCMDFEDQVWGIKVAGVEADNKGWYKKWRSYFDRVDILHRAFTGPEMPNLDKCYYWRQEGGRLGLGMGRQMNKSIENMVCDWAPSINAHLWLIEAKSAPVDFGSQLNKQIADHACKVRQYWIRNDPGNSEFVKDWVWYPFRLWSEEACKKFRLPHAVNVLFQR